MEKNLKEPEKFESLSKNNRMNRTQDRSRDRIRTATPTPTPTSMHSVPMLTKKPFRNTKLGSTQPTESVDIEYFVPNMGNNNDALPKSINSQFDIPPLEVSMKKKPIGKAGEQEKLYRNFKSQTSRKPDFAEMVDEEDESDNKLKTNESTVSDNKALLDLSNNSKNSSNSNSNSARNSTSAPETVEGFYSSMNSRFSGPTPAFTSTPYQTVPEHPPVPEFNVEEAESLFSNYNGRSSRTPNYIDKSGMVEGFVGGEVVKSLKTKNPYDISGCRYDGNSEKPLHDVIYGAPVASCTAYGSLSQASGTVFYPLNA